ncbi:MAG: hypothetical protein GY862_21220, partial [Gammaproteobacteria bacterium]|nr:hypothetical protein [Gammaproteobacteria bacterium]
YFDIAAITGQYDILLKRFPPYHNMLKLHVPKGKRTLFDSRGIDFRPITIPLNLKYVAAIELPKTQTRQNDRYIAIPARMDENAEKIKQAEIKERQEKLDKIFSSYADIASIDIGTDGKIYHTQDEKPKEIHHYGSRRSRYIEQDDYLKLFKAVETPRADSGLILSFKLREPIAALLEGIHRKRPLTLDEVAYALKCLELTKARNNQDCGFREIFDNVFGDMFIGERTCQDRRLKEIIIEVIDEIFTEPEVKGLSQDALKFLHDLEQSRMDDPSEESAWKKLLSQEGKLRTLLPAICHYLTEDGFDLVFSLWPLLTGQELKLEEEIIKGAEGIEQASEISLNTRMLLPMTGILKQAMQALLHDVFSRYVDVSAPTKRARSEPRLVYLIVAECLNIKSDRKTFREKLRKHLEEHYALQSGFYRTIYEEALEGIPETVEAYLSSEERDKKIEEDAEGILGLIDKTRTRLLSPGQTNRLLCFIEPDSVKVSIGDFEYSGAELEKEESVLLTIIEREKQLAEKRRLSAEAETLLRTPVQELARARDSLQHAQKLDNVLASIKIPARWLDEAIAFTRESPAVQADILAQRLSAQCEPAADDLFRLHLHESFPLGLESCFLYFPGKDRIESEIENRLRQGETEWQKTAIITLDAKQQQKLRAHGKDLPWIVPTARELTNWLLFPDPVQAFARTLVEQIKVTQISPYQTQGGINKSRVFFGRTQILAKILNRDPGNYLVAGGRKLGKSSLLKHLDRNYRNHPAIQPHYLSLQGSNLPGQLSAFLGLPAGSSLDALLARLAELPKGQRHLLLIDEADLFVREEMKTGYRILNAFRSLSEQGCCHFILAGFWDLYQASVNYQSPLKNFGEPITIGALEADACRDLIIKPMQTMKLRYASETLVENLVNITGQRANLIAIVCDEMLKGLNSKQRVLGEEEMEKALYSDAVRNALAGWEMLTGDEQANRLDRIIVYTTVKKGEFTLSEVTGMGLLDAQARPYTSEQLKQSLARLSLSFVVKREPAGRYVYCVPLFRQILLEDDVDALLAMEQE